MDPQAILYKYQGPSLCFSSSTSIFLLNFYSILNMFARLSSTVTYVFLMFAVLATASPWATTTVTVVSVPRFQPSNSWLKKNLCRPLFPPAPSQRASAILDPSSAATLSPRFDIGCPISGIFLIWHNRLAMTLSVSCWACWALWSMILPSLCKRRSHSVWFV